MFVKSKVDGLAVWNVKGIKQVTKAGEIVEVKDNFYFELYKGHYHRFEFLSTINVKGNYNVLGYLLSPLKDRMVETIEGKVEVKAGDIVAVNKSYYKSCKGMPKEFDCNVYIDDTAKEEPKEPIKEIVAKKPVKKATKKAPTKRKTRRKTTQ